jgi:hypothetical protein
LEVLVPGSGLTTTTAKLPAEEAAPAAVSCVGDTNTVVSDVVPRNTLAPDTNLLPATVRLKFPEPTLAGFMPVITGVGLISVTALEELASMLVAATVAVFGSGSEAGAVYLPLEEIVPREGEPPPMPLTAQVTLALDAPETVAVNWNESPARMFAEEGETVTDTEVGAEGELELLVGVDTRPQPARSRPIMSGMPVDQERIVLSGPRIWVTSSTIL